MTVWDVLQYSGVYDDFYKSCSDDAELQRALDRRISQLMEYGNQLQFPASRFLEDGIYELRAKSAKHQARLLYYFDPGKRAMIVVAFLKDQRKIDKKYIDRAKHIREILRAEKELSSGKIITH